MTVERDEYGRVKKGKSLNPKTQFKKGQKPPPTSGRKPTSPEMKAARQINRAVIEEILNHYCYMSVIELANVIKDTSRETIDVLVARILFEAIKKGDQVRLAFVLDRLLGKPKESVDLNVTGSFHSQVVDMIHNLNNAKEQKED